MSFGTLSSFSTNYQTLDSLQLPSHQAWLANSVARLYASAGGLGSWNSVSHSTSMQSAWGSRCLATGMARGAEGTWGIQSEKETMQCLYDDLAFYLKK